MTVEDWLLDSDPAIRWQALRDLSGESADVVAEERARVATEGWGAKLLALQRPDGHWGDDPSNPEWITFLALFLLRDMGLDPKSDGARRAVGLVRDNLTWHWWGKPFFDGEVEPCINGRVLAISAYFGEDSHGLVDRLLGEQMADGGWNCEQESGSTRGSFNSTINVLEGLLEHERCTGADATLTAARERGQDYLLERRMLRLRSTGEVIEPEFVQLSSPITYHYDVLRGLDYLRGAGVGPDERVAEAVEIVASKGDAEGRWAIDAVHDDDLQFDMGEALGQPSRWITLRALRVLRWARKVQQPRVPRVGADESRSRGANWKLTSFFVAPRILLPANVLPQPAD